MLWLETHISRLYFTGDHVLKVKKAVKQSFLDYSDLERRRFFCEEEVRLGARGAPDVYLGVRRITQAPGGGLQFDGEGAVVEYGVWMRQLPRAGMLDHLLDRGAVDRELQARLLDAIVAFQRAARRGPEVDRLARPRVLARRVLQVLRDLDRHQDPAGIAPSRGQVEFLRGSLRRFLRDRQGLLHQRLEEGRACEGHGDLHAGNVCFDGSRVVFYDCIEFDAALRCQDVAGELAFLCMDLDRRGYRAFSRGLERRFADRTHDPELAGLLPALKAHYASVRALVSWLQTRGGRSSSERPGRHADAQRYLALACGYFLPPALIVLCGLPGSGKSFAAQQLAAATSGVVVRSDVVRKELLRLPPGRRPTAEQAAILYRAAARRKVYAELLERAAGRLQQGRTTLLDATYSTRAARRAVFQFARQQGVPCVLVHCTAPESEIRSRLDARAARGTDASDADWEVYCDQRDRFEYPLEVDPAQLVTQVPAQSAARLLSRVVDAWLGCVGPREVAR